VELACGLARRDGRSSHSLREYDVHVVDCDAAGFCAASHAAPVRALHSPANFDDPSHLARSSPTMAAANHEELRTSTCSGARPMLARCVRRRRR
jgi:hypothetical protein